MLSIQFCVFHSSTWVVYVKQIYGNYGKTSSEMEAYVSKAHRRGVRGHNKSSYFMKGRRRASHSDLHHLLALHPVKCALESSSTGPRSELELHFHPGGTI